MNPLSIGLISFVFIFGGTLLGFYLGGRLPQSHLSSESKETVKMAWGMVATMSELVLSLLVASAKSSFDAVGTEKTNSAAKIVMLDHDLARYGPETAPIRGELRQALAASIQSDGQDDDPSLPASSLLAHADGMRRVEDLLAALAPATDSQRALLSQARQISDELYLNRVLVIEQAHTFLPNVLLFALVAWLTLLFVGASLFAPRNKTVLVTLLLCCASLSFAIFLINDLSHPLHGILTASNAPLREALAFLNR
jgi:hypothetical protein